MDSEEDEVQEGGKSSQIFCLTWVKRKAAKSVPDRIQLTQEEVKDILKSQAENK